MTIRYLAGVSKQFKDNRAITSDAGRCEHLVWHTVGELEQGILGSTVSELADNFADILLRFVEIVTPCFTGQPCLQGKI